MIGDSREVLKARIQTLKHIRAFIEINIKAREEELSDCEESDKT